MSGDASPVGKVSVDHVALADLEGDDRLLTLVSSWYIAANEALDAIHELIESRTQVDARANGTRIRLNVGWDEWHRLRDLDQAARPAPPVWPIEAPEN